jgi:site-specific recombinase XerD
MDESIRTAAISPLRQRLIDDMNMRRFSRETQRNYIRDVGRFATFLRRSPDTATADDVRRFQIEQRDAGMPTPTMNSIVSALRFFFTHTIDRPDHAQADPGGASAQPASGAEPGRGRATAQRDHLPQASGSSLGRLWRRPARG